MSSDDDKIRHAARELPAVRDHRRTWGDNLYVYPVISRRSRGLSIGVNLSPCKTCTFRCVYCQVDRRSPPATDKVDMATLIGELDAMLGWVAAGDIWKAPRFDGVPEAMRRLNDIALSGDGEPTAYRRFADVVQVAADAKARHRMKKAKTVVISNASRFHTQAFRRAVPILQADSGEIWAKLDAGSPDRFSRVHRTKVRFKTVLANIEWVARAMPTIIQTCFFRLNGRGPSQTEIELYIARLRHVLDAGGSFNAVQVYTVARAPAEATVSALSDEELDALAGHVRDALGGILVEAFYGADVPASRWDADHSPSTLTSEWTS